MKWWFVVLVVGFSLDAAAQVSIKNPPKPDGRLGERGTGTSSVGVLPPRPAQPQIVQITAISQEREWTNTDGKVIKAQLLSFTTPPPGESQPITVLNEGNVRLYLSDTKKSVDYPLKKLSEADQVFVKKLGEAIEKAAKKKD